MVSFSVSFFFVFSDSPLALSSIGFFLYNLPLIRYSGQYYRLCTEYTHKTIDSHLNMLIWIMNTNMSTINSKYNRNTILMIGFVLSKSFLSIIVKMKICLKTINVNITIWLINCCLTSSEEYLNYNHDEHVYKH